MLLAGIEPSPPLDLYYEVSGMAQAIQTITTLSNSVNLVPLTVISTGLPVTEETVEVMVDAAAVMVEAAAEEIGDVYVADGA